MALKVYKAMYGLTHSKLPNHPEAAILTYWCEAAELYIFAGEESRAIICLHAIRNAVREGGQTRDFIRTTRFLLDNTAWSDLVGTDGFDDLLTSFIEVLALAGEYDDCFTYLQRYAGVIISKEARYVHLCNLNSYTYWLQENYAAAIKWGGEGVSLVKESRVDTKHSAAHSLALAQRDGGDPSIALEYFKRGYSLEEILGGKHDAEDEVFFGNVGRCLQLMGQIEPALRCYYLSARAMHRDGDLRLENDAYLRQWVGELLLTKRDHRGFSILREAYEMWSVLSPPKAKLVFGLLNSFADETSQTASYSARGEIWSKWMRETRALHKAATLLSVSNEEHEDQHST